MGPRRVTNWNLSLTDPYDKGTTEYVTGTYGKVSLLTWVLKVDVVAVVGIFQFVGHHPQSHNLLADEGVWACDVHADLGVVHLVGQSVLLNFRKIPLKLGGKKQTITNKSHGCWFFF